jgi:hypothetical protein
MKFILDQLPFYQAICYAALIHAALWTLIPLITARIIHVPIKEVSLMYGQGKTYMIMGYNIKIGWIPGASIQIDPEYFTKMAAWKWIVLGISATSGLFIVSRLIIPSQDLLREIPLVYHRLWISATSPWDTGGTYLYEFGKLAEKSTPRAVSLICLYSASLQLLPWPPFASAGSSLSKLIPERYYTPLSTLGGLLWFACAISLIIAYVRACLLFYEY